MAVCPAGLPGPEPRALPPAGCVREPSFCQLAEIRDSAASYFTCTLYPEARVCDNVLDSSPAGCSLLLPHRPSALFRKKGERLVQRPDHCTEVCRLSLFYKK